MKLFTATLCFLGAAVVTGGEFATVEASGSAALLIVPSIVRTSAVIEQTSSDGSGQQDDEANSKDGDVDDTSDNGPANQDDEASIVQVSNPDAMKLSMLASGIYGIQSSDYANAMIGAISTE